MLNTPPTYAIYIAGLVFEWLQGAGRPGGDGAAQHRARRRCCTTTSTPATSTATRSRKEDRSRMNVPFTLRDAALDDAVPEGREGSAAWCS